MSKTFFELPGVALPANYLSHAKFNHKCAAAVRTHPYQHMGRRLNARLVFCFQHVSVSKRRSFQYQANGHTIAAKGTWGSRWYRQQVLHQEGADATKYS